MVAMLSVGMLRGQTWFDAGLKGGIGTSMMYNKQIFDNQEIVHKFKPAYAFGAKLGFNFIQEHQITFDVMMSQFSQAFTYRPESWSATTDAVREFTISGMDLLLMYRTNRNGTYFEIGPQWSSYSSVKYTDEGGDFISPAAPADMVNSSNFGITAGFGGYILGTDNFGIATGLRFNYMITDMASASGKDKNFPVFTMRDSNPTHNLSVMFVLEINYDFGYLVSPSCGTRGKLFVF
ncbi:hypothetical protein MASR1M74_29250 [Lentimicrobium sp.]